MGWTISSLGDDLSLTNESSGLNSLVFEKTTDGVTEYAYVFGGTKGLTDIRCDELIALNVVPKQLKEAVDNATKIHEEANGAEITFVGHSLGGMEAAAASMKTGDAAITFNPAALTEKMINQLELGSASQVDNFVLRGVPVVGSGPIRYRGGDPLYNIQSSAGRTLPGNVIKNYYMVS